MARDDYRDAVGRTGSRHGTDLFLVAELLGDLRIRNGLAKRDLSEQLPNLHLERRRLNVDRQVEPLAVAREMFEYLVDKLGKHAGIFDDLGVRIFLFQAL